MTDDSPEVDGGTIQEYRPEDAVTATDRVSGAADTMEEFNRFLWQLAKSFWIITAMLLGIFLVFAAYYVVKVGVLM